MTYPRAALTLAAALFLGFGAQAADTQLAPRTAVPKTPTEKLVLTAHSTGALMIKFVDQVRARPTPEGGLRATQPVDAATLIFERFGLKAENAYPGISEDRLAALEARAAQASGKAQPDLAGMMRVTGPRGNIEAAAKALNQLDLVEWVNLEDENYVGGDPALGTPRKYLEQKAAQLRAERDAKTEPVSDETSGGVTNLTTNLTTIDANGGPQEAVGILGCCLPNYLCVDLDPIECSVSGGTTQPTLCTGGPCGACCTQTGCVEDVLGMVCTDPMPGGFAGVFTPNVDCTLVCLPGACCLPGDVCQITATQFACEDLPPPAGMGLGGFFQGSGSDCEDADCDIDCGQSNQNCWAPAGGGVLPYCDDPACCNLICDFDPYCCDAEEGGQWDALCAAAANLVCFPHTPNWDPAFMIPVNNPPTGPDRCASPFNATCFEEHPFGGCNKQSCCNTVCLIEPTCCANDWDFVCADLARVVCVTAGTGGGGVTPSFEDLQGYLTEAEYPGGGPIGFDGEGWNLIERGEPYTDLNFNNWWDPGEPYLDFGRNGIPGDEDEGETNGRWDPPNGLYGLAEQLLRQYHVDGTGAGNLTRGRTTKIGVIEWGWWPGHEDLTNVRTERGQTIIEIPELAFNDHGTACLSIINALENSSGVTGIVPEAEGWFFPVTSVEDGPRFLSAWVSAIEQFGRGDVLSASYGPPDNLNNTQETWTLFRMASDMGITVCVAAGNGCRNLDDATDLGDSGAIVVGACSPGFPYFRLSFSNFCTAPDLARSNIVHLKAWGSDVTACGYGDLQLPLNSDPRRTYTASFGGTSAATPQIAGLVAGLQGVAKQFYGIPISPEQIRLVMGAPGIPPVSPPRLFGGFDTDQGCSLDLDPDQGPHMIGVYPETVTAISRITGQSFGGFDDSPRLDDAVVVRGQRIQGTRFSLKGNDQVYLEYDAIYTKPGDSPVGDIGLGRGIGGGEPIPEIADIEYIASGSITDLVFVGRSDIETVNTLIIENHLTYPNVFNVMVVELYDHRREEFTFVDFATSAGDAFAVKDNGDLIFAHVADSSSRFIQRDTKRIVGRIWTIGFPNFFQTGFGGSGDDNYQMNVDLLNIFVSENFGEQLPGGG